ncbi:hypothetical protein [Zongyangia hominis]|uniref:Gram-positive cocci surface proteins LPxTG domain-containing protein n=1 Tax=Zongyangia hominis TaxID=2763677 RepID=A0A926EAC4_9FIRM|nr:hypothetical protein [Zongyangia hominis]MBC8569378.1 hypothetical protein [Zongyangia hominis]
MKNLRSWALHVAVAVTLLLMTNLPALAGEGTLVREVGGNPATGDTSGMMLGIMVVLLGASLIAIVAVALVSAKKKKK